MSVQLKLAVRYGCFAMLAASGSIVILRMLAGPLAGPLRVTVPLNPEGWFGLAATGLLAARNSGARGSANPAAPPRARGDRLLLLVPAGLIAVAFGRALRFYFLSDDFVLLKLAREVPAAPGALFTTPGGDGFFRPIGYITLALSAAWCGTDPGRWHATALALHALNALLVFGLASRTGRSRAAALFAAALFGVHGASPEAAVWIAGRFDLVATAFLLAGLLLFLRSREAASGGRLEGAAALASMAAAVLSKESAYVFPLLLLLLPVKRRDPGMARIRSLWPYAATAAALFAYRCWLFGGIGGYRDSRSGEPQALMLGPSTFKALGMRLWTALYFPLNWSAEPGGWLAAMLLAYLVITACLAARRRSVPGALFPVAFVLVSSLPPLHMLVIGPELGNGRLLYLPCAGFSLMLASAWDAWEGKFRGILAAAVLAFQLSALEHNLDAWQTASVRAEAVCRAAASGAGGEWRKSRLPGTLAGVPFFANGFPECVELERRREAHTQEHKARLSPPHQHSGRL